MIRKLTRKEKERYIALFEDEEYIKMLKEKLGEKWYVKEKVVSLDENEFAYYLYTSGGYDDEFDELTYLQVMSARNKAELDQQAKDYQNLFAKGIAMYWSDIAYFSDYFTRLGKRFGLLKEFRENGIL